MLALFFWRYAMPRLKPTEVAAATQPSRTPKQLANDARLRSKRIKSVAPVVIRPMVESQEHKVGQDGVREFNKDNELPHVKVEPPEGKSQKWLEDMAFANEIVTVMIHESTDKTANPFPEIWVNGRAQRFVRGNEQKVRRCYVEKLARLKLTTFANFKTKNMEGDDVYRYPSTTALLYPFVVIGDSEKGKAWLKQILAEA